MSKVKTKKKESKKEFSDDVDRHNTALGVLASATSSIASRLRDIDRIIIAMQMQIDKLKIEMLEIQNKIQKPKGSK